MTKCTECETPAEYVYYGRWSKGRIPLCSGHLDIALENHFDMAVEDEE